MFKEHIQCCYIFACGIAVNNNNKINKKNVAVANMSFGAESSLRASKDYTLSRRQLFVINN